MLISTEEAEARLNNPNNLARRKLVNKSERQDARAKFPEHEDDHVVIRPLNNGGRRPGDKNITEAQRATIGAEAQLSTLDEVAEKFGISRHHAHELGAGKVYTDKGQDDNLIDDINEKLSKPHQLAVEKLTKTLLALDDAKIAGIGKAKDIASVAANLSRIAETTAPLKHDDDELAKNGARIIVYSPTIKQENHYSSVETTSPTTTD